MGFSVRPAVRSDLPWCADILDGGFEHHPRLKCELPRLWRTWLAEDAAAMIVIIDDTSDLPVAFGMGGLLSDDSLLQIRRAGRPHLALQIAEREARGEICLLRPDAVRRVNHPRQGVNLCVLHYSEVIPGRSFDEKRVIRHKALGELLAVQRGYAAKEFVYEPYGESDLAFAQVMGTRVRNDYRAYFEMRAGTAPPSEKWPFLVGLSLTESEAAFGSAVGLLFSYLAPLLLFSPMQQRVLARASRTPKPFDPGLAHELAIERSP